MNCRKCGNLLNENDSFCTACGEPVVAPTMNQQMGGQFINQGEMSQTISPTEPIQQSQGIMVEQMPSQPMQQPMNNMQQPMNNMQQPMNNMQLMNNQQPEMMQQPMNNMQQPMNNQQPEMMQQPINNMQPMMQQQMSNEQPMNNMQQPMNSMQQPMMQQPMNNMQQPMMNQSAEEMQEMNEMLQYLTGTPQEETPQPKKFSITTIFILLTLVFMISTAVYMAVKISNNDDTKVQEKDNKTNKTDTKKDNDNDKDKDNDDKENKDDEEEREPVVADNTNVFESDGYKFTLPNGLKYQINNDYSHKMLLFSDGSTFAGNMVIGKHDATLILQDPNYYVGVLQKAGFTVQDSTYLEIGGVGYILYKTYLENKPLLYYITGMEGNTFVEGAMQANVSTGFNTGMEYVSKILMSVEKATTFAPGEETTESTEAAKPIFNDGVNIEGIEYSNN